MMGHVDGQTITFHSPIWAQLTYCNNHDLYDGSTSWSVVKATYVVLPYCEHGGVGLMGLKRSPWDPSSFSAVTLLVGSFDL